MDFTKYVNDEASPRLEQVLKPLLIAIANEKLTESERRAAVADARIAATIDYRRLRDVWQKQQNNRLQQFWIDAWKESALSNLNANQMALIQTLAWERGHSSGLEEVFREFTELTEFLLDFWNSKI